MFLSPCRLLVSPQQNLHVFMDILHMTQGFKEFLHSNNKKKKLESNFESVWDIISSKWTFSSLKMQLMYWKQKKNLSSFDNGQIVFAQFIIINNANLYSVIRQLCERVKCPLPTISHILLVTWCTLKASHTQMQFFPSVLQQNWKNTISLHSDFSSLKLRGSKSVTDDDPVP